MAEGYSLPGGDASGGRDDGDLLLFKAEVLRCTSPLGPAACKEGSVIDPRR